MYKKKNDDTAVCVFLLDYIFSTITNDFPGLIKHILKNS